MTAFPQHNASEAEWHDWRWQMRHRVHDLDTLARYIRPTDSEREAVEKTAGIFRWTIGDSVSTGNSASGGPILQSG